MRADAPIHQIRYGWSESSLLGTRGMGPVEATVPAEHLTGLDGFLRNHVWAAGPEPGFTFLQHRDSGVMVRKYTTPAADGRPGSSAHVLLCPALRGRDALGLTAWDGWDDPELRVLHLGDLDVTIKARLRVLREHARTLPVQHLATLFAHYLSAPSASYTMIGEPDPLAVVCALGDLVGQPTTFATDEADDASAQLPAAVFLRRAPSTATAATRRRISSTSVPADRYVLAFTTAVADAYVTDGTRGLARIRPTRPPLNVEEVHRWAHGAQFAPGVLADLTRLPRLPGELLHGLAEPQVLRRIADAAQQAPPDDLAAAVDGRLPSPLLTVVVRHALARVFCPDPDLTLLQRLGQVSPLPESLVVEHLPVPYDQLALLTQTLLPEETRRRLLEAAAADLPFTELVQWVDEQAGVDPGSALAAFSAICVRTRTATPQEVRALLDRGVLAAAVQQFADTAHTRSLLLTTLLSALPEGTLTAGTVDALTAGGSPVLLHALDTVVTDRAARAVILHRLRFAYYHDHQLREPMTAAEPDGPSGARETLWRRFRTWWRHRRIVNDGNPT